MLTKTVRFNANLHQRDSRNALFGNYEARTSSQSPAGGSRPSSGYGYRANGGSSLGPGAGGPAFSAYSSSGGGVGAAPGYRSATPNAKGHYSDSVLESLESQNDEQIEGMSAKVRMLKDVSGDSRTDQCAKQLLTMVNCRSQLR